MATRGVPVTAIMSTPLWFRPPDRLAPQVLEKATAPATGQTLPPVATAGAAGGWVVVVVVVLGTVGVVVSGTALVVVVAAGLGHSADAVHTETRITVDVFDALGINGHERQIEGVRPRIVRLRRQHHK